MSKCWLINIISFFTGIVVSWKIFRKKLNLWHQWQNEYKEKHHVLTIWLKKRTQGKKLNIYLNKYNYSSVAIYGLGEIGEILLDELIQEQVNIKYIIDKEKKKNIYNIPVHSLEEPLEPVDVIIVTPIQVFDEIKKNIESKITYHVVSIEEVIYEW